MNINIQVVYRKDKINQNNTIPIHLRFTQNRKIRYVSTGITINISDLDSENQCIKAEAINRQILQYQIDTKLNEYERKVRKMEALDMEVTLDTLLETNHRKARYTLADCFAQTIERLETLGKFGSASKHKAALSLLNQFRTANIRLEEIDLAYLQDFELFLRKKGNRDNSIATKLSLMKAVYNRAVSEELFVPKTNPFTKFKVGRLWTPTRKRAINKEELQKLIDLKLPVDYRSPYLSFARDIFLFTYYTVGINFRDIATLRYVDIQNGRIYYTRHKTGKEITCKLMPCANEIIRKYSQPQHADRDYIFPILDNRIHLTELQKFNRIHKVLQHVNIQLKELGRLADIKTPLTTYVARHTYATVLKRSGVNIAIISESLGHSDLSTTQIYLDSFENTQIDEAMKHLL